MFVRSRLVQGVRRASLNVLQAVVLGEVEGTTRGFFSASQSAASSVT
jgi:hypothetical protein